MLTTNAEFLLKRMAGVLTISKAKGDPRPREALEELLERAEIEVSRHSHRQPTTTGMTYDEWALMVYERHREGDSIRWLALTLDEKKAAIEKGIAWGRQLHERMAA